MNTTEPKWIMQSRGIWSALMQILTGVGSVGGYTIQANDIAQLNGFFDQSLALYSGIALLLNGILGFVGRLKASQPLTIFPRQSGFIDYRLILLCASGLLIATFLAGCKAPSTSSCDYYKDPVYKNFCRADLTIEAARREVHRQRTLPVSKTKKAELDNWEAKVNEADDRLNQAELIYREQGLLLKGDQQAIDLLLNQLEAWVYQ